MIKADAYFENLTLFSFTRANMWYLPSKGNTSGHVTFLDEQAQRTQRQTDRPGTVTEVQIDKQHTYRGQTDRQTRNSNRGSDRSAAYIQRTDRQTDRPGTVTEVQIDKQHTYRGQTDRQTRNSNRGSDRSAAYIQRAQRQTDKEHEQRFR